MSSGDRYEQLKRLMQAISEPYQGTVYHYTSADGISGIIGNNEIWMSNTAFMNDTTELKALENDTRIKDSDFTNDAVKEAWRRMTDWRGISGPDYYMASFSEKPDLLEQWRAYGNFCIGFDASKLATIKKRVFLYKCLYTDDEIRGWILEKARIPEWGSLPDEEQQKSAAAFHLVYVASMKYKNEHFRAEQEVRLVATSHHNWYFPDTPEAYEDDLPIHFRPHPLCGFVPYIKFFEPKVNNRTLGTKETETQMKQRKLSEEAAAQRALLPITEVIVGPIAYQREAETACRILLSERGYKQVPVRKSAIPYRGVPRTF